MKKPIKKIISIVLVALMFVSVFPVNTAQANVLAPPAIVILGATYVEGVVNPVYFAPRRTLDMMLDQYDVYHALRRQLGSGIGAFDAVTSILGRVGVNNPLDSHNTPIVQSMSRASAGNISTMRTATNGAYITFNLAGHITNVRARTSGGSTPSTNPAQRVTITTSVSPSQGGTVSGGGTFNSGTSQQVTARANSGWVFDGWFEGNTRVNQNAAWRFNATSNRTLQARFRQGGGTGGSTPTQPALTVRETVRGSFTVTIPANTTVHGFSSPTATTRQTLYTARASVITLHCTQRLTMSDGSTRYLFRSGGSTARDWYLNFTSAMSVTSGGASVPTTPTPAPSPIPSEAVWGGRTWQAATQLGERQIGRITIPASNDESWFRVVVPSPNQTISLSIEKAVGGRFDGGVSIVLFDESTLRAGRTHSVTSWGIGTSFQIWTARDDMNWRFTEAGTYYIQVRGGINLSELNIQYTLIDPDSHGNNNSWQNATPMPSNTPVNFTITASNDESWFRVVVPSPNQTISLSIEKAVGGRFDGGVSIVLFDESTLRAGRTHSVTSWGIGTSFQIWTARDDMNWRFTEAGTYYIQVRGGINLSPLSIRYTLLP